MFSLENRYTQSKTNGLFIKYVTQVEEGGKDVLNVWSWSNFSYNQATQCVVSPLRTETVLQNAGFKSFGLV
jgi:hypothetical protein